MMAISTMISTMHEHYRLSFAHGGLLVPESMCVVELYDRLGDWEAARQAAVEGNALRKTRKTAAARYFRGIRRRLEAAHDWEWEILRNHADEDRIVVLFVLAARYYRLMGDFVSEVVRDRYLNGPRSLESFIFGSFYEEKAMTHPELTQIADSTAIKIRTVTMRTLREAGIAIGKREPYEIARPRTSRELLDSYCRHGSNDDLLHLLLSDAELAACR